MKRLVLLVIMLYIWVVMFVQVWYIPHHVRCEFMSDEVVDHLVITQHQNLATSEIPMGALGKNNIPFVIENKPLWLTPAIIDYEVTVTIYYPTVDQCDNDPHITADGTKFDISRAGSYRYCALSRDLLQKFTVDAPFAFGDTVTINGIGDYSGKWVVKDTMNKRWTNTADLLVNVGTKLAKFKNAKLMRCI